MAAPDCNGWERNPWNRSGPKYLHNYSKRHLMPSMKAGSMRQTMPLSGIASLLSYNKSNKHHMEQPNIVRNHYKAQLHEKSRLDNSVVLHA